MDELLPLFEREGIRLNLEAHPDDFIERNTEAVDLVRGIDSPLVGYVFCAPHCFYLGDDIAAMIGYAAPVLAQVHIADVLNHRASSGLRYNNRWVACPRPPAPTRQGEVDWDACFGALRRIGRWDPDELRVRVGGARRGPPRFVRAHPATWPRGTDLLTGRWLTRRRLVRRPRRPRGHLVWCAPGGQRDDERLAVGACGLTADLEDRASAPAPALQAPEARTGVPHPE
jgi:hypothetical protein